MKEMLIIIGAGGHGRVVADIAIKMNKWKKIGFLDDNETIKTSMGLEVIAKIGDAYKYKENADFFVALGNNTVREKVQEKLVEEDISVTKLIHPSAVIGTNVVIGMGTAIMAGVVINNSTEIGKGCIINTCASVDHDSMIDNYVHFSVGVRSAGGVGVGKGTFFGIGSVISSNVNICSGCTFGAGAVVVKSITEPGTYVGVPVRRLC